MSSANARISSGSSIALPPNFTTTTCPAYRLSQGSDSMSASARAAATEGSVCWSGRGSAEVMSAGVRAVLVHVVVGQVVGEDGGRGLPGVQVDADHDLARREIDLVARLVRS